MSNYLTTDELVTQLHNQTNQPTTNNKEKKRKKISLKEKFKKINFKITRKKIFWLALILAIIHIFSVSVPLLSENRGINAYKTTTILAIPMNQEIDDVLDVKIVKIKKIDLDNLEVGEKIILFGEYGTQNYWVKEIVSIDSVNRTVQTTFDGVISHEASYDDLEGIYIEDANILGIISYVSSNLRGYIFLLGTYFVIFSMVYVFYIRKKEDKPIA